MTKQARFGNVQVQFREDGTLHIYQPDANRVLSAELAEQLTQFLMLHALSLDSLTREFVVEAETVVDFGPARQGTVPDGMITTSEGPVSQPDPKPPVSNPGEAESSPARERNIPPATVKRRPGRPRKVQP